ncbi:MAG: hypothetical protein ABWZ98_03280 [Nakamurella sp.]
MSRRIVLFELNEVPWRIVDEFIADHPHSTLARILPRSRTYTSVAADRGHLSPWTTWPTLHRGVNDEQHMIASFGQDRHDVDESYPPVWQLLHNAGVSVGICGSLHSYPAPDDIETYSFYLPDTFASEPTAFPAELAAFQEFNLTMVRASSRNVDTAIPRKAALEFLRHTPKIGIRPSTFAALAKQLAAERRKPWLSTRRRSFQSVFAFDLFRKQLETTRPAFSTFFTNHVASAMHRYWAAGHPGDYDQLNLSDDWMGKYRDEVPWAMGHADEMIGRLATFVESNPDYELWIASSMGQGPTFAQPLETQLYLADLPKFMSAVGAVPAGSWTQRPAMLPQCNVQVDANYADGFDLALNQITVAGQQLKFRRGDGGFFSMEWGQPNLHGSADAVLVRGAPIVPESIGLTCVEIEERSDTTAYHVPQGIFSIYDPQDISVKYAERPEVSVLEIAPTILDTFGVAVPDYMQSPSLLAGTVRQGVYH